MPFLQYSHACQSTVILPVNLHLFGRLIFIWSVLMSLQYSLPSQWDGSKTTYLCQFVAQNILPSSLWWPFWNQNPVCLRSQSSNQCEVPNKTENISLMSRSTTEMLGKHISMHTHKTTQQRTESLLCDTADVIVRKSKLHINIIGD